MSTKAPRIAWMLFPLILVFAVGGIAGTEQITLQLPEIDVAILEDHEGYASFSGTDIQFLSNTGEPALPFCVVKALLPPDADPATLQIGLSRLEFLPISGSWDVRPTPPLATWDGSRVLIEWPEGISSPDGKNRDIYEKNARYPSLLMKPSHAGRMRRWRLVDIPIILFQYNPVAKALYRLKSAAITIRYQKDRNMTTTSREDVESFDNIGTEKIRKAAVNFNDIAPLYQNFIRMSASTQVGNGYVIITTSSIESNSTQLANFTAHMTAKGFNVQIISESQWGGSSGDAAAENLRNWLQDNYLSQSIEYVLLIGDPDPGSGNVPMKMLWPRHNATSYTQYKNSPSDFYYADLTGDWDLDNDGYYGEYGDDFGTGGVDRNWDVLVGRIPYYGNMTDLDHILEKIISYGSTPLESIGWRRNVLLPMEPSDGSTPGYHLGEEIKDDIIIPKGSWGYHRVYEENYGLSPVPETVPCTKDNVTNAWNGVPFGAVFWWTHGSSTSASDIMDTTHAATLNDTYPAFTFQCSCLNAYPEVTTNLAYSLLKNGCIATVGATRVSWYYVGQQSFSGSPSNSGMTYEYASRLITNGDTSAESLYDLKQSLYPSSESIWMNFTVFNVYGNPANAIIDHNSIHTVSNPTAPTGPAEGEILTSYTFNSGGASCSQGHDVEYRFDWNDGSLSDWTASSSASHTWNSPGTYTVRTRARCAVDNSIISDWISGTSIGIATCLAPTPPENPSPGNGDENVFLNQDLNWDDSLHATSYDVYFGTTSPPPFLGNTLSSEYNLAELQEDTQYFWNVAAKNGCGSSEGEEWHFTTGSSSGTHFFIPFGSLSCGNVNIVNCGDGNAEVYLKVYDGNGALQTEKAFTIPKLGVTRTWDQIGNIYDYGKPVNLEIESDQPIIGDNIKWADPPYPVGSGFSCLPLDRMKGKLFYFPFSAFGATNAYCDIANATESSAAVMIEVYDAQGGLKHTESFSVGAKSVIRSWDKIGNIQNIADPALLKITSDQDIVVDTVRWENNEIGWGFAVMPVSDAQGSHFFIPFGSLSKGNINIANPNGSTATGTLRIRDQSGTIQGEEPFSITSLGVIRSWDIIGNVYDYGKPVTVEITSSLPVIGDNIKWADPPYPVGSGFSCLPTDLMKGRLFYFPFSGFSATNAYCDIANITDSSTSVTIEVYDAEGRLKHTESFSVGAKSVIRSWDKIGNIQNIADPAMLKITSDQDIVVDAVRWENNEKGWGFAVMPASLLF